MGGLEADTVVILSSELISKIVGEYFNKKMFKENVEIVDLKPTETGYMFSIAFVKRVVVPEGEVKGFMQERFDMYMNAPEAQPLYQETVARGKDGKFTKVKE